ncbi:DUF4124 domain-containing protein [Thermodesulfobacteriota bacterium]
MKRFTLFIIILLMGLSGSIANADIYKWIDESGVMHFSNCSPPEQARILMKTTEIPYDEATDKDQMKAERMERLELAELELAEKEVLLERRQREADERIAEADQKAEEALQRAKELAEKAESQYERDRISYAYRPYYKYHYVYGSHYWNHGKIYPKRHRFKGHLHKRLLRHRSSNNSIRLHFNSGNNKGPYNTQRSHNGLHVGLRF